MNYSGMNASTGQELTELDHIRQSCKDIFVTPIGSRVMRREYGSLIPDLIDQPMNASLPLRISAAGVMALLRWEPRIRLKGFLVTTGSTPGSLIAELDGTRADGPQSGTPIQITVPLKGTSA